jgi:hypothetical protein
MPPVADAKGTTAHLIVNPAGSAATLTESLTRAARERGIGVRVLEPGEDGVESLAVAGGDGTVAAVAGVAVEHNLPLVVVPTGTLNHFARDLRSRLYSGSGVSVHVHRCAISLVSDIHSCNCGWSQCAT